VFWASEEVPRSWGARAGAGAAPCLRGRSGTPRAVGSHPPWPWGGMGGFFLPRRTSRRGGGTGRGLGCGRFAASGSGCFSVRAVGGAGRRRARGFACRAAARFFFIF
jgi:hypothetical protein